MISYYRRLMHDWAFTKNNQEYPRYAISGLRYSSDYTLKMISKLNVGDQIEIFGYTLKRVA